WVPEDVYQMGYQDELGNWRCGHIGCRSSTVFERACDLRKHHSTHTKTFFCTRPECVSSAVGFASQKDYRRHLNSHKPSIPCLDTSCKRVFSRMDNMRNHVLRMHQRKQNTLFPKTCRNRGKSGQSSITDNSSFEIDSSR
ncbi:hypothetical protein K456DRAFT_1827636, partial [Colletotrichum gloeosporioides 23]